jgi:uncharacterized membrane protein
MNCLGGEWSAYACSMVLNDSQYSISLACDQEVAIHQGISQSQTSTLREIVAMLLQVVAPDSHFFLS